MESICECMDKLDASHSILHGNHDNTTMIHFLLGMDAFCVFYTPLRSSCRLPQAFNWRAIWTFPLKGYVCCYPAKVRSYLGGDIISGMIDTGLYKKNEISIFFDIGTNGELVIGNRNSALCGAGAAGRHWRRRCGAPGAGRR